MSSLGDVLKDANIDADIKDKFMMITPKTSLYFDLDDHVTCTIKFDYHHHIINYFDSVDILRNDIYEREVLHDLINSGFTIDNQLLSLENIDAYDTFIEETLPMLSQKYNVFTSEKLNKKQR